MKILLVRPKFDEATEYSHLFAGQIIEWCSYETDIELVDLEKADAVRSKVESKIAELNPDVFCFYDHGNEDILVGNDEVPVIDLSNCYLLANIETYTLACLSAKKLGRDVYANGGRYWGYVIAVSFTTDALEEFATSFNCGFRYLFIEKRPAAEALSLAKNTFQDLAMKLLNDKNYIAAICMSMNGDSLRYYDGEEPGEEEEEPEGCMAVLVGPLCVGKMYYDLAQGAAEFFLGRRGKDAS